MTGTQAGAAPDALIASRAIETVFQPLVDLASGDVVGFEALSRGPDGSPWESPTQLFAAARQRGREAELDWVCRANAYRAALDAGLPPGITLFVNMEPAAHRVPCPADLRSTVAAARRHLRVVTEMTEQTIADDPPALLAAAAASRECGWGVAIDDVGNDPASLALMPFVHPDVVKLDVRLLRRPSDRHTVQVVSAVLAYAEATGATVVAEGIETPQQVAVAQSMGAVIGQGWHLGSAERLPPGLVSPATPLRLLEPFDAPTSDRTLATPFSIITARRPAARITKRLLTPLSRFLESRVAGDEEPPVLLACFQEARHFTEQVAFRFSTVAQRSPLVAAIAVGLSDEPAKGVRGARLGADDPLRGEWNVVVVGPHYAAALTARDVGDTGADNDRRFDFVITHDRPLVIEAARSLLRCLTPTSASHLRDTPIAT